MSSLPNGQKGFHLLNHPKREQEDVYSFLRHQLEKSKAQDAALEAVINKVEQIETNVTSMYLELKDSITILYAEQDMLKSKVAGAAYDAAKEYLIEDGESYPLPGTAEEAEIREMAGYGMRYQWKLLKDHFEVSKYIHIRRIDFQNALTFLDSLILGDEFVQKYKSWVSSKEALKKKRGL